MNEYLIFAFICFVLVALGLSVVKDLFGQKSAPPQKRSAGDILPTLPMIQTSPSPPGTVYPPFQNNPYPVQPVNGYPQPVNYQPVQQQPALDPFTVNWMSQLIQQQQGRGNHER